MATAAEDAEKKITLTSSDGVDFEVEEATAKQSVAIANIIEDGCAEGDVPIFNVTGKALAKILEYCKKHADFAAGKPYGSGGSPATQEEIAAWDAEYINVEQDVLYDIIMGSNFLYIQSLLDLGCQRAADMIKGRTPAQIREWFNIPHDFSPEEEEEVEREILWIFS